ncbi:STAS domain protein [Burkholderia cepacia]|nr:STAS domain protein [Burkholderia cepacia]
MSGFEAGSSLTVASAKSALADGLARIGAGATAVDCAALTQFDSSALAVLLAWQRAAKARGATLDILNLPRSSPASRAPTASTRSSKAPGDIDPVRPEPAAPAGARTLQAACLRHRLHQPVCPIIKRFAGQPIGVRPPFSFAASTE